jgi:D-hexose-6-phosphate mutarotase
MSVLTLQSGAAIADIDTTGAYLTQLKNGMTELLFPAQRIGEKMRGGIPLCAPIFGPGDTVGLRQHGFARDVEWKVTRLEADEIVLSFDFAGDPDLPDSYDGCRMTYTVKLRENSLFLQLNIENQGEAAFICSPGFHPYFPTSNATEVTIRADSTRSFTADELLATQFLPPHQEKTGVRLDGVEVATSSQTLQRYAVWSANPDKYICVEPTWAGYLDDQAAPLALQPGQYKDFDIELSWSRLA